MVVNKPEVAAIKPLVSANKPLVAAIKPLVSTYKPIPSEIPISPSSSDELKPYVADDSIISNPAYPSPRKSSMNPEHNSPPKPFYQEPKPRYDRQVDLYHEELSHEEQPCFETINSSAPIIIDQEQQFYHEPKPYEPKGRVFHPEIQSQIVQPQEMKPQEFQPYNQGLEKYYQEPQPYDREIKGYYQDIQPYKDENRLFDQEQQYSSDSKPYYQDIQPSEPQVKPYYQDIQPSDPQAKIFYQEPQPYGQSGFQPYNQEPTPPLLPQRNHRTINKATTYQPATNIHPDNRPLPDDVINHITSRINNKNKNRFVYKCQAFISSLINK